MKKIFYKNERQVTKDKFEKIQLEAKERGLCLVIDDNRNGEMRFANFTKNKLTRKINASGDCTVFFITPDFVPLSKKIIDNVKFIES